MPHFFGRLAFEMLLLYGVVELECVDLLKVHHFDAEGLAHHVVEFSFHGLQLWDLWRNDLLATLLTELDQLVVELVRVVEFVNPLLSQFCDISTLENSLSLLFINVIDDFELLSHIHSQI